MQGGAGLPSGPADSRRRQRGMPHVRNFKSLPGLSKASTSEPLKVCVVTSEILGPVKNGGIGTATSALIANLTENGHKVTILYTLVQRGEPECAERNWAYWVEQHARNGTRLIHIPHEGDYRDWLLKSWLVKQHLAAGTYDVVYFNEHHGSGYYALAAKRAGLSPFAEQVHCVITHGSIEWVFNANDQRISRATDLQMIGVERRSVEWADVVIGPSQYLLREYASYGWALPRRCYNQPYPFPLGGPERLAERRAVDEVVFFGRLETRKGLWLFCEALDRMGEKLRGRRVTFMGRPSDIGGLPSPVFILARAEKWACEVNLLLDYSQEQALAYLSQPGRVAVMPSLADNSPCVVYECMQQRIPFVATLGSGADELIHTDCWPAVMCEPTAVALAARIEQVLDKGAATAWPRFEAAENLARWKAWGELLADPKSRAAILLNPTAGSGRAEAPVGKSAFLYMDDRTVTLGTMLDNLQRQMERFKQIGTFALISSRDEPLRTLIEKALQAKASLLGCEIMVVSPASLGRFLQRLRKRNGSIFVSDICDELAAGFVETARLLLARDSAVAVSCAAASRSSEQETPVIHELPAGDLPAAGGLGMPITSSAWAISGAAAADYLKSSDFSDVALGDVIPAQDIGQLLFHRLLIAEMPVRLIPEVGTVRTSPTLQPQHRRHWYRSSVLHAEVMGVKPYLFQDAAPWLAASTFGFRGKGPQARTTATPALPDGHPLKHVSHSGTDMAELARFAAALGRADQAMQIAAASDISARAVDLMDTAILSIRSRPAIDLYSLLAGETSIESAAAALKALRLSTFNLSLARRQDGLLMTCANEEIPAATATFFDVSVDGHQQFTIACRAAGCKACDFSVTIIDQSTGAVLSELNETALADKDLSADIALNGIYGLFCLIVEVVPENDGHGGLSVSRMQIV